MRITLLLTFLFFSGLLVAQTSLSGTITHDRNIRNYRLYLPTDYDDSQSLPLVFNLHGLGSNSIEQLFYSQMNAVADTANFIVCYPDGIDEAWNVGWVFGSREDDTGFISDLIDTLVQNYGIDDQRIYSCGMSNGGFMSYRLACELNDKIAAVASVTGAMAPRYIDDCEPGKSVPVLEIHGTSDQVVPYTGDRNINVPISELMEFWQKNNSCGATPVESDLPDVVTNDSSTITRIEWPECEDQKKVIHFRVNGGGHTWPGTFALPGAGPTNGDIIASEEIWLFFKQYTLSGLSNNEEVFNETNIVVFPNPAINWINLNLNGQKVDWVDIYDTQGKLIRRIENINPSGLSVAALKAGLYLLDFKRDGLSIHAQSFIKQ